MTIQTILTEAGLDMSKWATENHFVSWIGLSPRNDVSGGRVLKRKTRKVVCRLATAFRLAATTGGMFTQVRHLQRKAAQHGFTLVSIPHST